MIIIVHDVGRNYVNVYPWWDMTKIFVSYW